MNRLAVFLLMLICSSILVIPGFGAVEFTGQIASTYQTLEANNDQIDDHDIANDQETGFGSTAVNLQVHGDVAYNVTAFAEVIGHKPNDFAYFDGYERLEDNRVVDLREAYVTLEEFLWNANVKVGRFQLDFGNQQFTRSTHARVQDNPLIGNALVDPAGVQSGVELRGTFRELGYAFSVTNGTREATVNEDRGFGLTGKLWTDLTENLSAAVSYHRVGHEDDSAVDETFADNFTNLYSSEDNYLFEGPVQFGTGVFDWRLSENALNGIRLRSWQADLKYQFSDETYLSGYVGQTRDSEPAETIKMRYWGLEGKLPIGDQSWLAARFGSINDRSEPRDFYAGGLGGERVHRTQIGVGRTLFETYPGSTMAKLEYVNQDDERNLKMASFDGFVGELSITF